MTGWKEWQFLEPVTSAEFQSYIQNQVVQVYASSAARGSALGTAVAEGMVSYLEDTNAMQYYDGSAWVSVAEGDITSVTTTYPLLGGQTSGAVGLSLDQAGLFIEQTQVNNLPTVLANKQATITGGATTITSSNLTASRALVSDGSGKVAVSAVTSTELGYVDGVTSAIQTQLDAKAPLVSPSLSGTITLGGDTTAQGGYSSANTDIVGLVGGSSFGGLVRGQSSGHLVLAIQDNDGGDSVAIISGGGNYTVDNTFDTAVARFMADGRVILTGNIQGGTTWTSTSAATSYNSSHSGETVRLTGATGRTFTLNSGLPAGHRIDFIQDGTGQITFAAGAGVTLKSKDGNLKTAGQYSAVSVIAYSTTEYYLVGDLGA